MDLKDILLEAHIQHAVGLVEYEVRDSGEVCLLEVHQRKESPRCGDDDLGPQRHTSSLLLPGDPVGAAVDSHGRDGEEVGKALYLLLDLDSQLSGRSHDDGVDFLRVTFASAQAVDDREEVGSGLASACLCAGDHVTTFEEERDRSFLYGSGLEEVHGL